ncbi:MAG: hypothetical protein HUU10_12845 [Bacteroidetes bacterium]|nr:hypothetical protein [Bacteroidota bacterium]
MTGYLLIANLVILVCLGLILVIRTGPQAQPDLGRAVEQIHTLLEELDHMQVTIRADSEAILRQTSEALAEDQALFQSVMEEQFNTLVSSVQSQTIRTDRKMTESAMKSELSVLTTREEIRKMMEEHRSELATLSGLISNLQMKKTGGLSEEKLTRLLEPILESLLQTLLDRFMDDRLNSPAKPE